MLLALTQVGSTSYWLITVLTGAIVILIPLGLVEGFRYVRRSGAKAEAEGEMIIEWPNVKKVIEVVLGDKTQFPEKPSLSSRVDQLDNSLDTLLAKVDGLTAMMATGNGKQIGAMLAGVEANVSSLTQEFRAHMVESNQIHRQLAQEIGSKADR